MNSVHAHAKVNLYLAVGSPEDGFHQIDSLFARIGLYDIINIEEGGKGLSLEINGEYSSALEGENLLTRIWDDLQGHDDLPAGLKVELIKNIPVGGGLGGGSSDAAEFLVYLYQKYGIFDSTEELFNYAYTLGKDIAFFLTGWDSAIVSGVQNRLEYFGLKCSQELFLWIPGEGVSTARVYSIFDRQKSASILTMREKISKIQFICKNCSFTESGEVSFNDLSSSFFSLCPQYKRGYEIIQENCCFPLLSGSGSTIFFFLKEKQIFLDIYAEKLGGKLIGTKLLGCSQVERQRVLVPPFGGSSPSTPAIIEI